MILTLFIVLTLVLAVLSLGLLIKLICIRRQQADQLLWFNTELERVSAVDFATGVLKSNIFAVQLENECRRAIREFTPLTLVKLHVRPTNTEEDINHTLKQICDHLHHHLSRPGDQLGRCSENEIGMLLPATNEHAGVFAERCHQSLLEMIQDQDSIKITLAACTFQPTSILTGEMAEKMVDDILDKALHDTPGGVVYHAQHMDDFSPTYS